jgi:hypothetical protein
MGEEFPLSGLAATFPLAGYLALSPSGQLELHVPHTSASVPIQLEDPPVEGEVTFTGAITAIAGQAARALVATHVGRRMLDATDALASDALGAAWWRDEAWPALSRVTASRSAALLFGVFAVLALAARTQGRAQNRQQRLRVPGAPIHPISADEEAELISRGGGIAMAQAAGFRIVASSS